jgi:DNA-binding transcriptional LysR family regulator
MGAEGVLGVTFAQLQSFSTIVRLGSVKAAAAELGVSEPAVSGAVAALRKDLGDELFVRRGGQLVLTRGGARLAAIAAEVTGLLERARRDVMEARGDGALLRVASTGVVGEYVASPLLDAFTRRQPQLEVAEAVEPADALEGLLRDRRADITLGPRVDAPGIETKPFLKHRWIVVAAPGHPLAGRRETAPAALAGERWLVDPWGVDPRSGVGAFFARNRLEPDQVRAFPSGAAALAAVAAGEGVTLALVHTVHGQVRRGTLVRLDVVDTPFDELWHASALDATRRPAAASALMRFVSTPEAMQAVSTREGGVPAERFRPPVYVTLWS